MFPLKKAKRFVVSLLIFFCIARPALYSERGVGPKIKGVQLGMRVSVSFLAEWLINLERLPFALSINSNVLSTGSITINFNGRGKELQGFKITEAHKAFSGFEKMEWKLDDLLHAIDKEGVQDAIVFLGRYTEYIKKPSDIITFTRGMRINSFRLYKKDFGAEYMSNAEFVHNIIESYHIPSSGEIKFGKWNYKNTSEGWQLTYYALGGGILEAELLTTRSKFD